MPQIEEVQFVHWGSLRPDPVPLLTDGINVATGPNGSGKTCFLDGLKLLLGVDDFTGGRTPAKYIFNGAAAATPADRAYLRATFANPVSADRRHRVFAWFGHGCEEAERVTIVCVVTGQQRWYAALPGRVRWGVEHPLTEDLAEVDGLPRSRRLGPRQYDGKLDQTGVTRALRGVLALPQGATDRLVDEKPSGMLRRLLELTGKQATLDAFREQRERYGQVREEYNRTLERFVSEQRHLEILEHKAERYEEWLDLRERLRDLEEVLVPAAHHRDLRRAHETAVAERDQRRKAVEEDEEELADLTARLPGLTERSEQLRERADALATTSRQIGDELTELDRRIGVLTGEVDRLTGERAAAQELAGGRDPAVAERELTAAREREREADRGLVELSAAITDLDEEIATLRAGRPLPPEGLDGLRDTLTAQGIDHLVVAESLDLPGAAAADTRVAAEAALGEALWGVVVAQEDYRRAVALAAERGWRSPIVAAGPGTPTGALAGLDGPGTVDGLLAHLDAPAVDRSDQGHDVAADEGAAVGTDGVRYGAVVSRLQAPDRPVLGRRAREQRLAEAENEIARTREEHAGRADELTELRAAATRAAEVAAAVRRLPELDHALTTAEEGLTEARAEREPFAARRGEVDVELGDLREELGGLGRELADTQRARVETEERLLTTRRPRLRGAEEEVARLVAELVEIELTDDQQQVLAEEELDPTASLESETARLRSEVDDESRYPADARDELVLAQRDELRATVEEVGTLLEGRKDDLDAQQAVVDEARTRYDEHVRAVIRLLNTEFARICETAGADGEIRLVPGDRPDEFGVDVRVAHQVGEQRRSYRDPTHSGGQRAKIAILVLLAAMGLGGAADLIVMDEHIAHLDSTNIDHIAELMSALRERVQFVLATPTNAESLRLGWCDLQLAFLPRGDGDAYTPPIRIMTRLGAEDLEARFAGSQLSLT